MESSKSFLWLWQLQSATQAEREREKKHFFHLYSWRSCSTQVTAGEMFFSILVQLAGTLKRISLSLCSNSTVAAIFFFFFTFQFILRFEKTATKWDISFLFYHFDLIILFLLFQDLDLFHVFSLGRYREDRKAITGANNKSETCGLFQNVLVLLGVLQSPGLVKNEECVKEWGCELTDAETGSENCRKERTRGEH